MKTDPIETNLFYISKVASDFIAARGVKQNREALRVLAKALGYKEISSEETKMKIKADWTAMIDPKFLK